jgi:hypothetical protein
VIGVHPHEFCEPSQCEPGVHVSSVGLYFHVKLLNGSNDTTWLTKERVRIEVDFLQDQIRYYGEDGVLRICNEDSHAPSKMGTCYLTFNFFSTTKIIIHSSILGI